MKAVDRPFEERLLGPRGPSLMPPVTYAKPGRVELSPLDVITRLVDAAERLDAAAAQGVKSNWSAAGCRALHTEAGACTQAALWLIALLTQRDKLEATFGGVSTSVTSSGDMTLHEQC